MYIYIYIYICIYMYIYIYIKILRVYSLITGYWVPRDSKNP